MGWSSHQKLAVRAWRLAERQHGVVARWQLIAIGFSSRQIEHRVANGRLHPTWRGVYAVGRPQVSQHGRWMAAVLACGPQAVLRHRSAAALWGIWREARSIEVSILTDRIRRRPGIQVYRRMNLEPGDIGRHRGIPVTQPICTLVDLAVRLPAAQLEAAVNEADKLGLVDPETLRAGLDQRAGRRGVPALRKLLDRRTFTLTDSELERRFLPIARRVGLGNPETGRRVNGFKTDFYWPELGLIVETDGLRYHRTPTQQAKDRVRDQTHAAAGLTTLRFTHAQIAHEADHVEAMLSAVRLRLSGRGLPDGRSSRRPA
jgi:very-short-patch-repair endonuclease